MPIDSSAAGKQGLCSDADFVEALARGLAVLESFGTARQRLNASQAAERAGLTRAAARRHLLTLARLGYLETDGTAFWLGPKVLRFSGSYLASARLPRLVQAALYRLSAQSRASYSVVVRDQDEVVIVARSSAERVGPMLAHGLHLGARLPLHATSTGRVLLAALPDAELHAWLGKTIEQGGGMLARLTPHTLTEPQALLAQLHSAREQGYCLAIEQHELGVCALAVPLVDMQGRVLAALNCVMAAQSSGAELALLEHLPAMQALAQEMRGVL